MNAALLLVLLSAAAPALPGKPGNVRVDADVVRYNYPKGEVTLTGFPNVSIKRDDATLTCKKAVAKNDASGTIASAVCTGAVRFTRGTRVVTCETATFDNAKGTVLCVGSPVVLRDGATEARGARLLYEFATDQVTLERAVIEVPSDELDAAREGLDARRKERAR